MEEKELAGLAKQSPAFERFIDAGQAEQNNSAWPWLLLILAFPTALLVAMVCVSSSYGYYISGWSFVAVFLGAAFLCFILVKIIRHNRWERYLKKRKKSHHEILRDPLLYQQMAQEYDRTRVSWNMIGPGNTYLFLRGHLPVEYRLVRSADYVIEEEKKTTTGTIPESLSLRVRLKNGQVIVMSGIPCPQQKYRKSPVLQLKKHVSLKERVRSDKAYTAMITDIRKKCESVPAEQKSIHASLTY